MRYRRVLKVERLLGDIFDTWLLAVAITAWKSPIALLSVATSVWTSGGADETVAPIPGPALDSGPGSFGSLSDAWMRGSLST